MGVNTQKYIRKPLYVDAVRVTPQNFDELVEWCQGEVETKPTSSRRNKKYIKVRVHHPKNPRQTQAFVGDWILYTDRGYKVYTNDAFQMAFDEVLDEREATAEEIREKLPHAEDKRPRVIEEAEIKSAQPVEGDPGAVSIQVEEPDEHLLAPHEHIPQEQPIQEVRPGADLGTTPQGEPIEVVKATPQAIADVVNEQQPPVDDEDVRQEMTGQAQAEVEESMTIEQADEEKPGINYEQHAGDTPADVTLESPKPGDERDRWDSPSIAPPEAAPKPEPVSEQAPQDAAAGKYVLSEKEQADLGPEGVRELIASGEAVLAQDLAESA